MDSNLPAGLTGDTPMPYGYRRWNGTVWCDAWTDTYNRLVATAVAAHRAGMHPDTVAGYVDDVYRTANRFDRTAAL